MPLGDGSQLSPLAWFKTVEVAASGDVTTVTYAQDAWDRMGEVAPVSDARAASRTTYVLEPGSITRTDDIVLAAGQAGGTIHLEFPTYSIAPSRQGDRIVFGGGEVASFEATGLSCEMVEDLPQPERYQTPVGPTRTLVACEGPASERTTLSWRIRFRDATP